MKEPQPDLVTAQGDTGYVDEHLGRIGLEKAATGFVVDRIVPGAVSGQRRIFDPLPDDAGDGNASDASLPDSPDGRAQITRSAWHWAVILVTELPPITAVRGNCLWRHLVTAWAACGCPSLGVVARDLDRAQIWTARPVAA